MSSPLAENMTEATAFAPASVGNIGVGFDIIGHTVQGAGDRATVRIIDEPVVQITAIHNAPTSIPMVAEENTAGSALIALRSALGIPFGFSIELDKGISFGSGMGGSAASAVAALYAANALLEHPLSRAELYPFALTGEATASGGVHGDNVGPMLIGGLVLATRDRLVSLKVPHEWHCALAHPHAEVETRLARAALKGTYQLSEFVAQSANMALFLTGCLKGDAELVREGLSDVLIEPRRAPLMPAFGAVKSAALSAGALGSSISGGGPSVFAWFTSRDQAVVGASAMQQAFASEGLESDIYVSPVNGPAVELVT